MHEIADALQRSRSAILIRNGPHSRRRPKLKRPRIKQRMITGSRSVERITYLPVGEKRRRQCHDLAGNKLMRSVRLPPRREPDGVDDPPLIPQPIDLQKVFEVETRREIFFKMRDDAGIPHVGGEAFGGLILGLRVLKIAY